MWLPNLTACDTSRSELQSIVCHVGSILCAHLRMRMQITCTYLPNGHQGYHGVLVMCLSRKPFL